MKNDIAHRLGSHLRASRERAGLGLNELARRSGVSPAYLSRLERAQTATGTPSESLLRVLAGHLGESPDALCARAGRLPADVTSIVLAHPEWWPELRHRSGQSDTGPR